jgi:hypothetical protein
MIRCVKVYYWMHSHFVCWIVFIFSLVNMFFMFCLLSHSETSGYV